ncbi:hypothetical protein Tco_1168629 [Tanacetum coccineum]
MVLHGGHPWYGDKNEMWFRVPSLALVLWSVLERHVWSLCYVRTSFALPLSRMEVKKLLPWRAVTGIRLVKLGL